MKNRLFQIIIAVIFLLPMSVYGQQWKIMKIGIEPLDSNAGFIPRNAYLMSKDTVISKVPIFNNEATFYVPDEIDEGNTYIVIKQEDQSIFRVLIKDLKRCDKHINTSRLGLFLLDESVLAEYSIAWVISRHTAQVSRV